MNVVAQDHHVAEFNWGILADDWGTPTVADFETNIDRVNDIAMRSPGYVWHMPSAEMEAAQKDGDGPLGANPRLASTLSVWETAEHLETFVHKTVHSQFMARRDKSHIKISGPTYVVWPVTVGHRPTISEAVERLGTLGENGPSSEAFDFGWLRENRSPTKGAQC